MTSDGCFGRKVTVIGAAAALEAPDPRPSFWAAVTTRSVNRQGTVLARPLQAGPARRRTARASPLVSP
jgi:hypothetical protein